MQRVQRAGDRGRNLPCHPNSVENIFKLFHLVIFFHSRFPSRLTTVLIQTSFLHILPIFAKRIRCLVTGIAHLLFPKTGNHYTWRKVATTVHNIIVGKLWVDNHGEMDIINNANGDNCHLKYNAYSYFSRETPRKVNTIYRVMSVLVLFEHFDCKKLLYSAALHLKIKGFTWVVAAYCFSLLAFVANYELGTS